MKQVILIRTDIKMGSGKIAAQACHASVDAYKRAVSKRKGWVEEWELLGGKKVVLAVQTLEALKDLVEKARGSKLPWSLITDAGHTELPAGTTTAGAIGPAPEEEVDKITGDLKSL